MPQHRWVAAGAATACLAGAHLLSPDPLARQVWLDALALPLGYGHLIGGLVSSRRRLAPRDVPATTAVVLGLLCALAAYTWALRVPPLRAVLLPALLLVSAWHILENDLALARAGPGALRLPPLRKTLREWAWLAAGIGALGLLALTTPDGRQWSFLCTGRALAPLSPVSLADLAAAVLLYHAASFLVFGAARARRLGGARGRRLRRALLLCHALPLLANALLACWLDAVHTLVAAPAMYLFWSVCHALDTARRRGLQR